MRSPGMSSNQGPLQRSQGVRSVRDADGQALPNEVHQMRIRGKLETIKGGSLDSCVMHHHGGWLQSLITKI